MTAHNLPIDLLWEFYLFLKGVSEWQHFLDYSDRAPSDVFVSAILIVKREKKKKTRGKQCINVSSLAYKIVKEMCWAVMIFREQLISYLFVVALGWRSSVPRAVWDWDHLNMTDKKGNLLQMHFLCASINMHRANSSCNRIKKVRKIPPKKKG